MNVISKMGLVALISVLPVFSYAQNCDLDVDEKDAFTGEHVKAGKSAIGGKTWHWILTLKQSASKYSWEMQIKMGMHLPEALKKGDIFYCKLENGKIIKMFVGTECAPTHVAASDGFIVTTYLPMGELTADDMKTFSESPLSEMRVVLSGRTLEPKITSKQGEKIQNTAVCILKQ